MERGTTPSREDRDHVPTTRPTTPPTRRTYDGSRRQADAIERRRRVVAAAEELFLTVGYGATSINEIARVADVSPQMIYSSFGSKAGILAKLADVVVAGDDASLHDTEGPLLRDRHSGIDELGSTDLRRRFHAIGHYAAITHRRSAAVLRLIDSVSGTDEAVAELRSGLSAGLREDLTAAVRGMPWDQVRPGLERANVADLLFVILGWRGYADLVLESGWTDEQYVAGIADALTHLLLPDDTS